MTKLKLASILFAGTALLGSSAAMANETLTVAATPVPHAEILNHIKPELAKEGIDLKVKEFTDYIQPNQQLTEKQVDANFYQTQNFLDNYNEQHHTQIVRVGDVHIEPFGLYSNKIKDIKDLKDGALVALPNDPANTARSLQVLEKGGLIKLKDTGKTLPSTRDLAENPKNLKFKEVEGAMLPRVLDDVDVALINTNYALQAGLKPTQDALLMEGKNSPYVNFVAVNKGSENDPRVQKLIKALRTDDVRNFINKKYNGAVIPAF